jgi:hypothetical protein
MFIVAKGKSDSGLRRNDDPEKVTATCRATLARTEANFDR